eukprot:c14612_g1_i1.p1 GENE.c14612_g1_i1~~c14612_g1_i1.p1  ORF type:complete len:266 (-),score=73.46 c14612_g1_i1:102-899(-)
MLDYVPQRVGDVTSLLTSSVRQTASSYFSGYDVSKQSNSISNNSSEKVLCASFSIVHEFEPQYPFQSLLSLCTSENIRVLMFRQNEGQPYFIVNQPISFPVITNNSNNNNNSNVITQNEDRLDQVKSSNTQKKKQKTNRTQESKPNKATDEGVISQNTIISHEINHTNNNNNNSDDNVILEQSKIVEQTEKKESSTTEQIKKELVKEGHKKIQKARLEIDMNIKKQSTLSEVIFPVVSVGISTTCFVALALSNLEFGSLDDSFIG